MIRFDNVSKIYSNDVVLKNINWEIRRGEKIGLIRWTAVISGLIGVFLMINPISIIKKTSN